MRTFLLTSLLVSMALSTSGCTNDGASLFVIGVGGLGEDCTVDESLGRLNGVVDVSLSDNLVIFPVFASQLRDRVSPNASNPADIHVQWVDVRLEDLGGNTLDLGVENPFRVPTNAFIESFMGSGDVPTGVGAVQVLPPGYAEAVRAATGGTALAALRPIGTTNGQIEVEGNFDYHYQINVCDGCLNRCAVGKEEPVSPCTPGQNSITITDGCPAGETCMAGVCSP